MESAKSKFLIGKKVLITGAGSGIGKACAIAFLEAGADVLEVVSFLLSSKASYTTGQSLAVEGGWLSALGLTDLDPDLAKKYGLKSENGFPL